MSKENHIVYARRSKSEYGKLNINKSQCQYVLGELNIKIRRGRFE